MNDTGLWFHYTHQHRENKEAAMEVGIKSSSVTIMIVPGVPAMEEERTGPEVGTRSSIWLLEGVVGRARR